MDSSVLELLLSDEQRGHGMAKPGGVLPHGNVAGGPATSFSAGDLLMPNNMSLPAISTGGLSGLSFMM